MTLIETLKKELDMARVKARVAMQDASKAKTFAEWQIAYHAVLLAEYHADNLELALGAALNSEYGWWQPGLHISHKPGSLEDTIAKVLAEHSGTA